MSLYAVITLALCGLAGWLIGCALASQVRGRAPGLSEHASPFGQTEARAERTLDPPRPRTASAGEGGAAPPPRAPEPPAARVG